MPTGLNDLLSDTPTGLNDLLRHVPAGLNHFRASEKVKVRNSKFVYETSFDKL